MGRSQHLLMRCGEERRWCVAALSPVPIPWPAPPASTPWCPARNLQGTSLLWTKRRQPPSLLPAVPLSPHFCALSSPNSLLEHSYPSFNTWPKFHLQEAFPPTRKMGLAAPPLSAHVSFVGSTRFCFSSSPIQHRPQGHGLCVISSLPSRPYKKSCTEESLISMTE